VSQFAIGVPLGFQQLSTALSAAVGLTVPTGARGALIVVETANVRWRDDGTNPTSAIGMLLVAAGDPFYYSGNLSALKFIAASGSPVMDVSYYG
jgi:hypothetical protein